MKFSSSAALTKTFECSKLKFHCLFLCYAGCIGERPRRMRASGSSQALTKMMALIGSRYVWEPGPGLLKSWS